MRVFGWCSLILILPFAAGAAEPQTIVTRYGGHALTIGVPQANPWQLGKRLRDLPGADPRVVGAITLRADRSTVTALAARNGLMVAGWQGPVAILAPAPGSSPTAAVRALAWLSREPGVAWAEPVLRPKFRLRALPADHDYNRQWQLKATYLDLEPVWGGTTISGVPITGTGIRIGINDSGVKTTHEDLTGGCDAGYDLISTDADPTPSSAVFDVTHGTQVAGTVGARTNTKGGVGVAYNSRLVPLRLVATGQTNVMNANAFAVGLPGWPAPVAAVDVSNNSWGPSDEGVDLGPAEENPSSIELAALNSAVTDGRGGKGEVITWAAGNGGDDDVCDRDGYASDRRVLAIGATTISGKRASYSERGCNLFVTAPVGNGITGDPGVVVPYYTSLTANIGDNYTQDIGTSFAAPLAAGVVALMLQANPNLTWRDVRHILAQTARQIDPDNTNWITNGAGLHWNLEYGFGQINGAAAVAAAATWTSWNAAPASVTPLELTATWGLGSGLAIPDNGATAVQTVALSAPADFRAEWVELTVDAAHPYQGDLAFTLTSPRGTEVTFLARPQDTAAARPWTLLSVASLGEDPAGPWSLVVTDVASGNIGTLKSASLKVYGYLSATPSAVNGTASGHSLLRSAGGTKVVVTTTPPPAASDGGGGGGPCGLGSGIAVALLAGLGVLLRFARR